MSWYSRLKETPIGVKVCHDIHTMRSVVASLLLVIFQANFTTSATYTVAFVKQQYRRNQCNTRSTSTLCHSTRNDNNDEVQARASSITITAPTSTRRTAMTNSAKCLAAFLVTQTSQTPTAQAAVMVDPDRYGDKELKMATVNVVKGKVHDLLADKPELLSPVLQLSMHDALTYDASTGEGGPDGGIVSLLLGGSPPRALEALIPAAKELDGLRKVLKRTTEITMADVVALAGAEAIETAGGPRLVVQLGKGENKKGGGAAGGSSYPDLGGKGSRETVIAAFRRSGLTERDVALFYGVRVAVEKVVSDVVTVEEEVQEVNEMGEKEVYIPPSTFGGAKDKYGKSIGTLDKAIFVSIMEGAKKKDGKTPDVFYDAAVADVAQTYAKKKADYVKDLRTAYGSWMTLGAQYTGSQSDVLY
mmetsp:Transcript_62470/g.75168  ORF Transcript_62470/g.75168 Transcript_62470/m.75168 type:complete len:417 (-) Transcript_62470:65-1315(-)